VVLDVGSGVEAANATHVGVLLWHIHSKYTVGHGQATCGGGCTCEPQLLKTALQSAYGTQVRPAAEAVVAAVDLALLFGQPGRREVLRACLVPVCCIMRLRCRYKEVWYCAILPCRITCG
jgi:hypothetical protein